MSVIGLAVGIFFGFLPDLVKELLLFILQGANDLTDVTVKAHVYSSSAQFKVFRTAHFVAIESVDRVADLFEQVGGNDQEWFLS